MPIDIKKVKEKTHRGYEAAARLCQFWRRAAGGFTGADLLKYRAEHDQDYHDRQKMASDPGYATMIIESMGGHFNRAKIEIENLDDKYKELIEYQMGGKGVGIQKIATDTFKEILTVQSAVLFTDAGPSGPVTSIMPRESIKDWVISDGEFKLLKWLAQIESLEGLESSIHEELYLFTDLVRIKISGDNVDESPNPLGRIPAAQAVWSTGNAFIDPIARIDYSLFNLLSEMRDILRKQAFNILKVPEGAEPDKLSASTFIVMPNDAKHEPGYIAYPSSGLDAHKYFYEMSQSFIAQYSRLRTLLDNQSGEAKKVDFMELEALLLAAASSIEVALTRAVRDWGRYIGQDWRDVEVCIDKQFIAKPAIEDLQELMQLKAIGIDAAMFDEIANKILHERYGVEMAERENTPDPEDTLTPKPEDNAA